MKFESKLVAVNFVIICLAIYLGSGASDPLSNPSLNLKPTNIIANKTLETDTTQDQDIVGSSINSGSSSLNSPIGGASDSDSSLNLTPSHIFINGTLGTDSFVGHLNVTSQGQDITNLLVSPGSFLMNGPTGPWAPTILISRSSILVSPEDAKNLKNGSVQEYDITVQNIPRSGRYSGTLYITYDEQPIGSQEIVPVTLVAYKFNVSTIKIDFINSPRALFKLGGTYVEEKDIELREDTGRAPPEVIETLAYKMNSSLVDLFDQDGEPIDIAGLEIFEQKNMSLENQSIILHTEFTNPDLDAGKYVGTLEVYSGDSLWPAISIPVEVRVSLMPGWLAACLILVGVVISFGVSHWNTKGKENNSIRIEIGMTREKMKGVVTRQCREKIENILGEAENYIKNDDRKTARTELDKAKKELDSCIEVKKKLDKTTQDIGFLIKNLEDIPDRADKLLKDFGVEKPRGYSLFSYLKKQRDDLFELQGKAERGFYNSVDEKVWDSYEGVSTEKTLNERLKDQSEKIEKLARLVDELEEIKKRIDSYPLDQRKEYEKLIDKNIIEFKLIDSSDDVTRALDKVDKRLTQISESFIHNIIYLMINLEKEVESLEWLKENEKDSLKAKFSNLRVSLADYGTKGELEKKLDEVRTELNTLKSKRPTILSAAEIDEMYILEKYKIPEVELRKLEPSESSKLKISLESNPSSGPYSIGSKITWKATAEPELPNRRTEYNFLINGRSKTNWTTDNTFIWIPREMDDKVNILEVRARYENDLIPAVCEPFKFILSPKNPTRLDRARLWLTFDRQKKYMEYFISIIAFGLATAFAYSQLYANNPTFGAGNTILGYLTLVLWGFGVDTTTTKFLDFYKALSA